MDPNVAQQWLAFLNPDILRRRMIASAVYIAAHESLKESIVDRIRGFFWSGFDQNGDIIDPKYQSDVLSRNRSPVYASLAWLQEMGAIADADLDTYRRVTDCRNVLAHQLLRIVGSEGLPTGFEQCFTDMATLLRKIEIWWIRTIQLNPDENDRTPDEEIHPGRAIMLQMMCSVALGDEEQSRKYLEVFAKHGLTSSAGHE